jgi:orotidine-5'-phosphate decarboxylase
MTPYGDRLYEAVERAGNPCLVGLDPHLDLIPSEYAAVHALRATRAERAAAVGDFLCDVIEIAAGRVAAVKPQSAFFELLGADGAAQWERVVKAAHLAGLLVIGDVKRGDIGSTATAYAQAYLSGGPSADSQTLCDAITLNPYLGSDAIQPFLDACRKAGSGLYVLVRTSNPSSAEFQALGQPSLACRVGDAVAQWGEDPQLQGEHGRSIGAVIGATHAAELSALRRQLPEVPFLVPGYGAQGGGAADVAGGFINGIHGALINSSRGILFAGAKQPQLPWKDATRQAIDTMAAELRATLL